MPLNNLKRPKIFWKLHFVPIRNTNLNIWWIFYMSIHGDSILNDVQQKTNSNFLKIIG